MKKRNIQRKVFIVLGLLFIIASVIIVIVFLTKGRTDISGGFPEPYSSKSLICTRSDTKYPYFEYDDSLNEKTTITLIFTEDTIETIALKHVMTYENENDVIVSEARNHASLNFAFADYGFVSDSFNASHATGKTKYTMSLFAKKSDLSNDAWRFFMIDNALSKYTIDGLEKTYEGLGFSCSKTN